MNPLVEKILSLTNEAQALEQIFEHEAKCECKHLDPENLFCSGKPSHRLTSKCGHDPYNVCDRAASVYRGWMERGIDICGDCEKRLRECWTIRPI